jgi:hypothetical protein
MTYLVSLDLPELAGILDKSEKDEILLEMDKEEN